MVVQVGCEDHARLGFLFDPCLKRLHNCNKVCNFVKSRVMDFINMISVSK